MIAWLQRPCGALRYTVYCRAYALATALRLTLPDAVQDDWLLPTIVHWLGAVLLFVNGCVLGWVLCAVGALVPLFFLEDQLSQSGYLLICAVSAVACYAGDPEKRQERLTNALPYAVRLTTLSVYALAGIHKVNRDFFDPVVSCANGGMRLAAFSASPTGSLPTALSDVLSWRAWPIGYAAVELGLVGVLLRRPAAGVLMAATLHVPLTIIFAPGFAFTMASGWVCFLTEDELRALWRTLRKRVLVILTVGGVAAALSWATFFPGRWSSDPDWRIKEVIIWLLWAWLLEAVTTRWRQRTTLRGRGAWLDDVAARRRGIVIAMAFALNGLTPYLGLQLHHTGAMLSNLRIDAGCHNSLLFPEAMRLRDPYVRIDAIEFAEHRATSRAGAQIAARLWGSHALWLARERWCAIHTEPLPVRGSYDGKPFEVADFCADDGWPAPEPWFPRMRLFQWNLTRSCPQICVH